MGYGKSSIEAIFPRTAELPFDFDRKHMTTDHHRRGYNSKTLAGLAVGDKPYITFTKGSVDGLLTLSTHNWVNGNVEIMNEQ